jgi:hypothetical protein
MRSAVDIEPNDVAMFAQINEQAVDNLQRLHPRRAFQLDIKAIGFGVTM